MTDTERRLQSLVQPARRPLGDIIWTEHQIEHDRRAAHEHYEMMYDVEHDLIEDQQITIATEK